MNAERKKMESVRFHVAPQETAAETLPGKPQPYDNTQVNGDGLIFRYKSARNTLKLLAKQYCK